MVRILSIIVAFNEGALLDFVLPMPASGDGSSDHHIYIWNSYNWVTSIFGHIGRRSHCQTLLPC